MHSDLSNNPTGGTIKEQQPDRASNLGVDLQEKSVAVAPESIAAAVAAAVDAEDDQSVAVSQDVGASVVVLKGTAPDHEIEQPTLPRRLKTLLIGKPRNLKDHSVFHSVSLIAFLAWVGLGADGLSSSCYGPSEAFGHLEGHYYLAVFLAAATILTVLVISACYSHIIEEFPSGGGGYLVASKLLSPRIGVVSGCALLVDYVLTVTTSIAAAGNALFGLLDPDRTWLGVTTAELKLPVECALIVLLVVMNLRGIKESVTVLLPIFLLFLITHVLVIGGAVGLHLGAVGEVATSVTDGVREGFRDPALGLGGMLAIFFRAYSLGAGTYTGIEAVSNSMPVMAEPRVQTAKRTMRYMAISLAVTAGGLMLAYLLLKITPRLMLDNPGKTMNQVLTEIVVSEVGLGAASVGTGFILATMICEGALLFVAAQAGFIDGPRVLANMAQDSYAPHWLGSLSERLSSQNGILLIGTASLAALLYTQGNVAMLLIMYSINVFVTFSLSMIGMCRHWYQKRGAHPAWRKRLALFLLGAFMCVGILTVTVYEKFEVGGWMTLAVTTTCVLLCFGVHAHYRGVARRLRGLDSSLSAVAAGDEPNLAEPDCDRPTAAVLVGGYSGLGVHTLLNALRFVPDHFENVIFLSVGVVDSGNFKGAEAVEALQRHTEASLEKYVDIAQRLGLPSTSYLAVGTDAVEELEFLCRQLSRKYPKAVFFAGQLVFQRDTWLQRLLHNQTAYSLQRRLQWDGVPMVILPTRVRDAEK